MNTQLHVFMQLPLLSSNVWKYLQNPLTGTKKKKYIYIGIMTFFSVMHLMFGFSGLHWTCSPNNLKN